MNLIVLAEDGPTVADFDPTATLVARLDHGSAIIDTTDPRRWGFRDEAGTLLGGIHLPTGWRAWPARDVEQARRMVTAWRWGRLA